MTDPTVLSRAQKIRDELEGVTNVLPVPAHDLRVLLTAYADALAEVERQRGLVEQAFRDGLAYATNVNLRHPAEHDIAWKTSKVRALSLPTPGGS